MELRLGSNEFYKEAGKQLMDFLKKPRACGCKGCRTCLECEQTYGLVAKPEKLPRHNGTYVYCPFCNKAWSGWNISDFKLHPNHTGTSIEYPGVYIDLNFLNDEEEHLLMKGIDGIPWSLSQSGRRKQNFGPKCNFKKRKLQLGDFKGFPLFSQFIQNKFKDVPVLKGFQTIEQCSLEYTPEKGASIDPHIDDCWIWGERIVTVNLLSDSVLTMTFNDQPHRYNLDCVKNYPAVLNSKGRINASEQPYEITVGSSENYPVIRIPMPRKSLLVLYGAARYDWEHQVLREDVTERRVCLAYREFTPPYLEGGDSYEKSKAIFEMAACFSE